MKRSCVEALEPTGLKPLEPSFSILHLLASTRTFFPNVKALSTNPAEPKLHTVKEVGAQRNGCCCSPDQLFWNRMGTGLEAGTRQCRRSVASSSGNVSNCACGSIRTITNQQSHLAPNLSRLAQSPLAWPNSCVPTSCHSKELAT